jgi:small subunit ribosomal protein S21
LAFKKNRSFRQGNKKFDGVEGLAVEVRNGDINKALRIFKKKVQEAGVIQEIRDRQCYVKPSEKRRKAKQAGRKRWLKTVEKHKLDHGY